MLTCTRRPRVTPPLRWLEELKRDWARTPGAPAGHRLRPVFSWRRPAEGGLLVPAADGNGGHGDYPAVYKAYGDRFLEAVQALNTCGTRRNRAGTAWGQAVPRIPPDGSRPGDEKRRLPGPVKAVLEQ